MRVIGLVPDRAQHLVVWHLPRSAGYARSGIQSPST
jgi:hypothetical protein